MTSRSTASKLGRLEEPVGVLFAGATNHAHVDAIVDTRRSHRIIRRA